jgi:hypothetical protein
MTLHLERIAPQHAAERSPWGVNTTKSRGEHPPGLSACRWDVRIVISNPDYFYCLLTRSLPTQRMHIIRP